jgi:hypothetical protein
MRAPESHHETDFTAQAKSNDVPELVVAPSGGAENEDVPERYQTREDLEKALNEAKNRRLISERSSTRFQHSRGATCRMAPTSLLTSDGATTRVSLPRKYSASGVKS